MLKRSSSSSSLRLWTRTQRGGAFFVSDTTEIVFFFESSSFFRGRERRAKERKRCTRLHERERERNDPFEPDDDVNDAKISLTFFLSSSRVSLSKHARLYTLLGPRTRTKKNRSSLSSFLKRVVVVSSGVTKSSTAPARQKARTKNAL